MKAVWMLLLEVFLWIVFGVSVLAAPAFELFRGDSERSSYYAMKALIAAGFLFVGYAVREADDERS